MHDELTKIDIQKMKEEIEYRTVTLRYELLEEVKRTRAYGDLSENAEYKEAKRLKNKNESRIRYLQNMIKTAKVIEDNSDSDTVGLYDIVTAYVSVTDMEMTFRIVTTIRNDFEKQLISKESPFGKAVLGHKVGDTVEVDAPSGKYEVTIKKLVKAEDDGTAPISSY
ncbi:MAG: transcription elongation factor GreA [Clostridia bacterium]|nr:transcription elongation factor GreA [Clostridia bacterium]